MRICFQALTLQGAIAHCDMPIESGQQSFCRIRNALRDISRRKWIVSGNIRSKPVQLAPEKGDALFFSPALFTLQVKTGHAT